MLEIFYAIPSCNVERCNKAFELWKRQGYKTAVLLDPGAPEPKADLVLHAEKYGGYYQSFNALHKAIGNADVIITGGDDIYPDMKHKAQELGEQFFLRFPNGFGIMQPIGDNKPGSPTICESPWVGKGWLKRAYQGKFPFWPEYIAFFGDTELKQLADRLKVLWMRRDVAQFHNHYTRPGGPPKTNYQMSNDQYWGADEKLFYERKAGDWPGHEALPE